MQRLVKRQLIRVIQSAARWQPLRQSRDRQPLEAEIQAKITGTILCTGPLTIGKDGAVFGDVTARSINIEPGGELNGAMNIVRTQVMPRPAL